ncbi:hypothetical protein [Rubrivirga marina]|uniref:Transferrin-binding protein B C-lobe/N-lobe beta barrel domain-containing protein n=1 Tax=Rubrivirga marina TaxID=1196024 RepID=A0A271J361_9BACT|nr:hypothetical protein [Rubrivirga marina]PAP77932.1 hypothetical protein BSZ37_16545 [Rubrivirga marina]
MRPFLLLLLLTHLVACDTAEVGGPVTFTFTQAATGPSSFAGTFTLTGAYTDSGTTTDELTITSAPGENPLVATGRRTVTGEGGSFVLTGDATVDLANPSAAVIAGTWRVASATGGYEGLTGSGTISGTADFAAAQPNGTVRYTGELSPR